MAAKRLMIVESPAKARTLSKFLGSDYVVKASMGHVRDLPKSGIGVDVEHEFQPKYVVPRDKAQVVKDLRTTAGRVPEVYLATDPDREGEAIAWHIKEALKLGDDVRRITFHEITRDAVNQAVAQPRAIDRRLVDAQQARRVLDRLVGYKVSPLLWDKVRRGLSAGRVQSVAVRLICERDREIAAFVPREYWTIDADLAKLEPLAKGKGPREFSARLVEVEGQKCGVDDPGWLRDEAAAQAVVRKLEGAEYRVADVRQREVRRSPAPPFITSTLQQEAGRKLAFTAKRTMQLAQQLYEGLEIPGEGSVGLITYMRTDSTQVAASALEEVRGYIRQRYGRELLPARPRSYRTRTKNAQEAHEAIRPTSVYREPAALRGHLTADQFRLYQLIWQRFVASQMESARLNQTAVDVFARYAQQPPASLAGQPPLGCLFRATGSVVVFPGFLALYEEGRDDAEEEEGGVLPEVSPNEVLELRQLLPAQHFTQPPPHYTESTLIKRLEESGVGRPSTYAPILQTIQERGYVTRDKRLLKATELGFLVNDILVEAFPSVFELGFTADMEGELDQIASGDRPWVPVVRDFYEPFEQTLSRASQTIEKVKGEATDEVCEKCGRPMVIKFGRFGRFLACSGYPECRNARPIKSAEDNGAEPARVELSDKTCEQCGRPMAIKMGRFGRFLSCTGYPECKHSQPFTINVNCPKCGRPLAERKFKGRPIWSCTGYPDCKFTAWSKPLEHPCPQCGGVLTVTARKRIQCTGPKGEGGCDYQRSEGEEQGEEGAVPAVAASPDGPTPTRARRARKKAE